jgi:hypothetical protein
MIYIYMIYIYERLQQKEKFYLRCCVIAENPEDIVKDEEEVE